MTAESPPDWNIFKQIFAEHWDGFKRVYPRYDKAYYDGLVDKMLGCGNPEKMGYLEYRCLQCGEGTHRVSMSCQSSLCLRCAKVSVDHWVSHVSRMLHEGVIYRHIVLTMPEISHSTEFSGGAPTPFVIPLKLCSLTPILGHHLQRPSDQRVTHAQHRSPDPRQPDYHHRFPERSDLLSAAW